MSREAIEARESVGGRPVVHVHLKVVPGASREGLAGLHGDRIRLRVTAAPESGKANRAVLALLARLLEVSARDLELVRGAGSPLKTVSVSGLGVSDVARLLASS